MTLRRRIAGLSVAALLVSGLTTVLTSTSAQAHGTAQKPGSRTWLCYEDGISPTGAINPINPACKAAVAISGPNSLYNWFSDLRSDAGGRTTGYIADGNLCSGGNDGKVGSFNFLGYDLARDDWPVTHLTGGANFNFEYSNWAHHPGTFYFYVTKDGFDPTTTPLKWSDLDPVFLSVTNPPNLGGPGTNAGHYYWTGTLPNKTGRHIIYSRWVRSDSNENFFACSDVNFDGGKGEVTGVKSPGTPGTTTTPPVSTTTTTPPVSTTTTTTTSRPVTTTTTTTTVPTTTTSTTATTSRPPSTTTTTTGGGSANSCTATYKIVGQWQGGFQGEVTVKNSGNSPLTSWNTGWTFANGQAVSQAWSANLTSSGGAVSASNVSYNGAIGVGQSTVFGFLASWNGTNSVPVLSCNGVTPGGGTTTTVQPATTTTTTTRPVTSTTTTTRPVTSTTTTTIPVTTTTTTTTGGGNGSLLNDGFEAQTGTAPALGWTTPAKDCSGTGTASIDSTTAHSGTKSLKITGGTGYCNHVFAQAPVTPAAGAETYVRAYIRHTTALPPAHVTFIAMNDTNDGNRDLRIGGMNGALMWNRLSDDAALPAQSPVGVGLSKPLATDSWQCFEFKVGANGTAQTWVNGTEIAGLTVDGVPTADIDQQWLSKTWRPALTNIRFGWESYGVGADTLWYDDIAVGTSRIGC